MAGKRHSVGVVVAAGGAGRRLGSSTPKQFLRLGGVPIIVRAVRAFEHVSSVREIVVVAPRPHVEATRRLCRRYQLMKVSSVVEGGPERQHSVWNGLQAFSTVPEIVLVHDAVRPLVQREVIRDVIRASAKYGAAVVGVRVKDTIKAETQGKGFFEYTLDRKRLWAVQTPQGFQFDLLLKAHRAAQKSRYLGTDEASLVERMGMPVRIVEGNVANIKITTRDDLKTALLHLKGM